MNGTKMGKGNHNNDIVGKNIEEAQRRSLIYWVNSFSNPYCLIASSSTDFKDGVVLCELVGILKGSNVRGVITSVPTTAESSMHNIALAIAALRQSRESLPEDIQSISPEEIYSSEDSMFRLLSYIKQCFEEKSRKSQRMGPRMLNDEKFCITPSMNDIEAENVIRKIGDGICSRPRETEDFEESVPVYEEPLEIIHCDEMEGIEEIKDTPRMGEPDLLYQPEPNPREDRPLQMTNPQWSSRPQTMEATQVQIPKRSNGFDEKLKIKLLDWLFEISLIKQKATRVEDFPGYCRNGVLLSDLIQRLEGRQSGLKGINRNPKTKTAILTNLRKCLEYLRSYPKMNGRFLWSEQEIIEGKEDIIWGLLNDIWCVFHNKPHLTPTKGAGKADNNGEEPRPSPIPCPLPAQRSTIPSAASYYPSTSHSALSTPQNFPASRNRRKESVGMQPEIYKSQDHLSQAGCSAKKIAPSKTSYSFLYSKSPISTNYHSGAKSIRKIAATPSYSRTGMRKRVDTTQPPSRQTGILSNLSLSTLNAEQTVSQSITKRMISPKISYQTFPVVSGEDERTTRNWLKLLNFTTMSSQEHESLLHNPFRNGLLLCELAERLEGVKLLNKFNKPETLQQASMNLELALEVFHQSHIGKIPSYFSISEHFLESLLKGEHDAVWGLLSNIRELYPQVDSQGENFFHLEHTGLPYSLTELRALELSLIAWLQSLHVLKSTTTPSSILDIEQEIRNGTLLCRLAQTLHSNKDIVRGMFSDPKTEVTAISNLRKALEAFRKLPRINCKLLWSERNICKGDRGLILALLEYLHKYTDGAHNVYGPYLGRGFHALGNYPTLSSIPATIDIIPSQPRVHITGPEQIPIVKRVNSRTFSNIGEPAQAEPFKDDSFQPRPCPNPTKMNNELSPLRSIVSKPQSILESLSRFSVTPKEKDTVAFCKNEAATQHCQLLEWLKKLNVGVPRTLDLSQPILENFRNGVLLAKIVGALERKKVEGISENPKSAASGLFNIRKVLSRLSTKKSIPLTLLYAEDDIHKGQAPIILELLECIKQAYRGVPIVSHRRFR